MPIAALTTRLVGAWLLFGAVLKLFYGAPADLPTVIRELPLDSTLLFRLAISVELVVAVVLLLRPSRGWLPAALLLGAFIAVLGIQLANEETSCGCFGSALTISPGVMLVVDGALILLLLLSRPWRLQAGRGELPLAMALLIAAMAVVPPFLVDRRGEGGYVELRIATWVGQPLKETPIEPWLGERGRIMDGILVFWRESCHLCAEHLRNLSATEHGQQDVVLLMLPQEYDDEEKVVETLPEGEFVQRIDLPDTVRWGIKTAPMHVEVRDGVVDKVLEGMDALGK
jgi:hypothetical protein